MKKSKLFSMRVVQLALLGIFLSIVLNPVFALYISENFTGATTSNQWLMPPVGGGYTTSNDNSACLTAGSGSTKPTATIAGSPPRCSSSYGNDAVGSGALRLTPAKNYLAGGIVSNFTFPTDDGVEITFTTYTFGGSGADGMSFMLLDGNKPVSLGATGGSLGYSCSYGNEKDGGVMGGYLGVGIDEFGNFTNWGDNSSDGAGFKSDTIGIRGAGSMNYNYFADPTQFLQDIWTQNNWGTVPLSTQSNWSLYWSSIVKSNSHAMRSICHSGTFLLPGNYTKTNKTINLRTTSTDSKTKIYGYPLLAYKTLSNSLDTPSASTRSAAIPIIYKIKITKDGKLSVWYSYNSGTYQPIILNTDIISTNGSLPSAFRFGFSGSTGGSTNNHDVTCFKAAPSNSSEGTATTNLPNGSYTTDAQVYSALYNSLYWTGNLIAQSIVVDSSGTPSVNSMANWDAGCNLTGGTCTNTGTTVSAQTQANRSLWSWNGSNGISLSWNNLNSTQQGSLKSSTETDEIGQKRLDFLMGDRSNEASSMATGSLFRARNNVLADIINSSPTWVGYPSTSSNEKITWTDALNGSTETPSPTYGNYESSNRNRTNVVYLGANDGFVHAFRSGHYDASKKFITADNDGKELFAYMPAKVLAHIYNSTNTSLDYSGTQYAHNFYVDATPGTGDVYYGGAWHTWLMGGLGSGGNAIYALDVTNPDDFTGSNIKGEWSYDESDDTWKHLGNVYGTPEFGRFHNGQWGAVFGNGWCSSSDENNGNCTASAGPAGIYVMTINSSGVPSFKFLSTGALGTKAAPNGIAYATPYDVDDDGIVDYVYAGDLQGNVWRFNLNGSTTSSWEVTAPQLIYNTGSSQPISTKVLVSKIGGKVILNFGTGRKQEGYLDNADSYATGIQSVYGLRDSTASTDLSATPKLGNTTAVLTRSNLLKQTIDASTNAISQNTLNWNKNSGWYLDLTTASVGKSIEYEQVIWNPYLNGTTLVVNTYIDASNALVSCETTSSTGYSYALKNSSGTGLSNFWQSSTLTSGSYRQQLGATGTSSIITIDGQTYLLYKTKSGQLSLTKVNLDSNITVQRISWREIFATY